MVFFPKKVELIGVLKHPHDDTWDAEDYPVVGAMGCFSEDSSAGIHSKYKVNQVPYGKGEFNWARAKEVILKETSGRGHGAVLDQSAFVFSIDNLTRASTLFLCGPEFASHVQQSLRRATAERGFFPENGYAVGAKSEGDEIMEKQFNLYDRMRLATGGDGKELIPTEDARIILPLNTKTAIQTLWNARELMHLKSMAERMHVPPEVADTVDQMYDAAAKVAPALMRNRGSNFEVLAWCPSPQLFAWGNSSLERIANAGKGLEFTGFNKGIEMTAEEIKDAVKNRDEALLANLKHYHFSFIAPMSIMTHHQATRQRTWNQSVEPIISAVQRGKYVLPESIAGTKFKGEFDDIVGESLEYVARNLDSRAAYGVVPHALEVYDAIHVNGWNALHAVGKRTCKTAQWEIRNIARYMSKKIREVAPELGKFSLPQGILYGNCPERENCGACKTNGKSS